jgi:hypothetical protein
LHGIPSSNDAEIPTLCVDRKNRNRTAMVCRQSLEDDATLPMEYTNAPETANLRVLSSAQHLLSLDGATQDGPRSGRPA